MSKNKLDNLQVFIDTNVWFSAFYKEGTCSKLLRLLEQSSHEIIISELVLEEIIHTIKQKIPEVLPLVIQYIDVIKPTVVKDPEKKLVMQQNNLADKKDIPILVAAIEFNCEFFITGNIKDFKVEEIFDKHKLKVLRPADFLKLLG